MKRFGVVISSLKFVANCNMAVPAFAISFQLICPTFDCLEFVNHIFTFLHFLVSSDAEKRAGLGLELFAGLPDVLCIRVKVFLVCLSLLKKKYIYIYMKTITLLGCKEISKINKETGLNIS